MIDSRTQKYTKNQLSGQDGEWARGGGVTNGRSVQGTGENGVIVH